MPEKSRTPRSGRKLGRGLSQVSHVFLSGVERQGSKADDVKDPALWLPDAGIISITSGDGVRGKTLVASSLGLGLSVRGRNVAVVNADAGKPDVLDIIGDMVAPAAGDVWRSEPDAGSISAIDLESTMAPGSSGTASAGPLGALEAVARQAQFVVVDMSPNSRSSEMIWKFSRLVVVIAEANTEKMQASYATIKRVHSVAPCTRVGLVVNLVQGHEEAENCFRKISNVCRRFLKINLRNYGHIVHSGTVNEAYQRAVPLIRAFPESKVAMCISSILGLIVMDESAIAKRRREVKEEECALKGVN